MELASRVRQLQPSQTLGITALVQALRREGKNVIGLGAGEPDFDTPHVIKEAAIEAIESGHTKYTAVSGMPELKEAVCAKYQREIGHKFSPQQVLIAGGAKHALANAIMALCESGHEIIIPAPYWTSYIELARFSGATPVVLETSEDSSFKITPQQLESAISPRSKVLLLNTPSNPTGAVYSRAEIEALLQVINRHDLFVVFDEIYEKILYDGHEHVCLASYPEVLDKLILINGVSKTYAMTGWRVGYLVAPEPLIKACTKIQGHTTSNPCTISQHASIAALQAEPEIVERMVVEFDERRRFLVAALNEVNGLKCLTPGGAFYTYPNIAAYLGRQHAGTKIETSMDLCNYLLEEGGVAVVPGEAFGTSEHIRISYATSMENLKEAVSRMRRVLAQLD